MAAAGAAAEPPREHPLSAERARAVIRREGGAAQLHTTKGEAGDDEAAVPRRSLLPHLRVVPGPPGMVAFADGVMIPELPWLRWSDPAVLKPDSTVLFYGPRRKGKTTLILHALSFVRHYYDAVFVVSPTAKVTATFEGYLHPDAVVSHFDDSVIERFIACAWRWELRKRKRYVLLILDDVVHLKEVHNSPALRQIFTLGRHLHFALWATAQYPMLVAPACRANADLEVSFAQHGERSRDFVRKNVLSTVTRGADSLRILDHYTRDHQAVVSHATAVNIDEGLFVAKARLPLPRYRMGAVFWRQMARRERRALASEEAQSVATRSGGPLLRALVGGSDGGGGGLGGRDSGDDTDDDDLSTDADEERVGVPGKPRERRRTPDYAGVYERLVLRYIREFE